MHDVRVEYIDKVSCRVLLDGFPVCLSAFSVKQEAGELPVVVLELLPKSLTVIPAPEGEKRG